jgi:NAD(P)-dependent dehydrogenase (short-subunit alcohol dehydrogenase family)
MAWTLVTGGAKRLGAEICRNLAKAGYDVIVHYNTSHQEALQVAEECRQQGVHSEVMQGDFSTPTSTQKFIGDYLQKFPITYNLINNVGNYHLASFQETSSQVCYDLFQTNFHAPFAIIQALLPSLKNLKGNIINLGVGGIHNVKIKSIGPIYCATKAALWHLTKTMAYELASSQVRVNMVSPGCLEIAVDLPDDLNKFPMKRAGKSSEVSRVITFLLAKESSYITGQNIEVAGAYAL